MRRCAEFMDLYKNKYPACCRISSQDDKHAPLREGNMSRFWLLVGTVIAVTPCTAVAQSTSGTTLTCRFTSGPLAGTTKDFTGVPGAVPAAIGSPCTDGGPNSGIAVAPGQSGTSLTAQPTNGANAGATSTLCRFDTGARKGQTQDYAPTAPLRVGSGCQDGAGSTGVVIARP